ncbi:MAG TPA: rRNA maturation RNase YbeY [Bacilli bacterium]|nr:rRNA maturation RNase YbeY [Bacilli bacterium]
MQLDYLNELDPSFDEFEGSFSYYAKKALKILEIDDNFIVEVQIVDNKTIKDLNKNYRNKNEVTDVLSFAFDERSEDEVAIISSMPRLLGVIIINGEKAIEQAKEYEHPLKREMKFLFIHGLLHLLGYDHEDEESEKEMFLLQDQIIGRRRT